MCIYVHGQSTKSAYNVALVNGNIWHMYNFIHRQTDPDKIGCTGFRCTDMMSRGIAER